MQIECADCKATYHGPDNTQQRVTDKPNVTVWGLVCPNCGSWQRTHYDSAKLRGLRYKIKSAQLIYQKHQSPANWERYTKARTDFRTAFDALQKEMTHDD